MENNNMNNSPAVQPQPAAPVKQKDPKKGEFWRFLLVGIIATVVDFGISYLATWLLKMFVFPDTDNVTSLIVFAIAATAGFLVSLLINFFLSKGFVFKNFDEKLKAKKGRTWWLFLLFAILSWILGTGLVVLGVFIVEGAITNFADFATAVLLPDWKALFNEGGLPFWIYFGIFCVKTIVVFLFNYFTRKYIIFRAPKAAPQVDAPQPAALQPQPQQPAPQPDAPKEHYLTKKEAEEIVRAELRELYRADEPLDRDYALAIVDAEIEKAQDAKKQRELEEAHGQVPAK